MVSMNSSGDDQGSPKPKVRKLCGPPCSGDSEERNPSFGDGESCGNGNLTSNLHPLTDIELVLRKVLDYLDGTSLRIANLVCKSWSNVARKLMMKKETFFFTQKNALEFLEESPQDEFAVTIKNEILTGSISIKLSMVDYSACIINCGTALTLVEKLVSKNIIVAKLNLSFCGRKTSTVWKIIRILHENVGEINLNADGRCCSEEADRIRNDHESVERNDESSTTLFQEETSFPNLRILSGTLRENQTTNVGNPSDSNIWKLFKQLIQSSPGLEGLHYELYPPRSDAFDIMIETPGTLQQLKCLSRVCLNQEELQILLQKNLKLRSLSMSLYSGFRYPAFSKFLSSQGESLETLEIDFVSLPNVAEKFSCGMDLVNLRHLTMKKFFGSILFVSHMPNLESLTLHDINLSVALHDEAAKYEYKSKLKSLQIFGGKGSTGRFLLPIVYTNIVSLFPELRCLRMEYLTNAALKIIVKGLPHLEELYIPKGIYSDVIISGDMGEDRVRNKCEDGNYQDQAEKFSNLKSGPPCLADLKRLRKVSLQSPKITDNGVRFGLVLCRELRFIGIDSPMISDISLKLLCSNPDIQELEFLNCFQITSVGISEAKKLWGKGRHLLIINQ